MSFRPRYRALALRICNHLRATALLTTTLAVCGTAVPAAAQTSIVPALPELITLSEAQAQTEDGIALAAAQAQFRQNLTNEDPAQTLDAAKEVVSLASRIWGSEHPQVSLALTNLAIVQAQAGELEAARQNFQAAIRLRERAEGTIVSPALINPLRGLASTNMALNNVANAVPQLERAIHLSHVNDGPNNLDQIEVMQALSEAYLLLGDVSDASRIQKNIYRLQRRRFATDSDQYLDALIRRAEWHARVENYAQATRAYQSVERTITKTYGRNDVRLIEPLVEIAFLAKRSNQQNTDKEALAFSDGRRSINRAVRIARLHADVSPNLLPTTLAKQGDYLMYTNQMRSARLPYKEAWELASADPALLPLRDRLFSKPVPIVVIPLNATLRKTASRNARQLQDKRGFVEVRYDITPLGRPTSIVVTNSEPAGLLDGTVVRKLRRYIYRPVFVDGGAVAYRDVTLRHEYRYSEQRLKPNERERIQKTEQARARRASRDTPDTVAPAEAEVVAPAEGAGDASPNQTPTEIPAEQPAVAPQSELETETD